MTGKVNELLATEISDHSDSPIFDSSGEKRPERPPYKLVFHTADGGWVMGLRSQTERKAKMPVGGVALNSYDEYDAINWKQFISSFAHVQSTSTHWVFQLLQKVFARNLHRRRISGSPSCLKYLYWIDWTDLQSDAREVAGPAS
jgi:hypothetical protein